MQKITVDLYTEPTNNAVLQIPGRRYPGVLVQGDTLRSIFLAADSMCKLATKQSDKDLLDEALGLRETLTEIVDHYERTLNENQISLPYPK
jgi:hypothetical protein